VEAYGQSEARQKLFKSRGYLLECSLCLLRAARARAGGARRVFAKVECPPMVGFHYA